MPRRTALVTAMAATTLLLTTGCDGAAAPADGSACAYPSAGQPARQVSAPATSDVPRSGTATVVLSTNEGDIAVVMDQSKAPCTVNSFRSLARQGYFDRTRCHRLSQQNILVLQCGDPTGSGSGGPGYSFADETTGDESYTKGVVAMANAGPDTNGSQFFLVYGDSTGLDSSPDYTIFATLDAASVAVVTTIAADGQDNSNGEGDGRPTNPAEIIRTTER
jgi:peptidyl-prolyl cis-trans isomerase B (cyclophilin B)